LHGGIFFLPNSSFPLNIKNITIQNNSLLKSHLTIKTNEILLVNSTDIYLKKNKITDNYLKLSFFNFTNITLEGWILSFISQNSTNITVMEYFNDSSVKLQIRSAEGNRIKINLDGYPYKPKSIRMNTTSMIENKDWFWIPDTKSLMINFTILY
ncbi:MAG: hypothetical protein QW279_02120, partial [Candidatus Jordarchaeaceae archaeon]